MMSRFFSITARIALFAALCAGIVVLQFVFDAHTLKRPSARLSLLPASVMKIVDVGLHSATASLLWVNTIQQLGTFDSPYTTFLDDIQTINALDQKFSYPYAFAILMAPTFARTQIPEVVDIAKQGIQNAAPDWRIPYYLAVTYHMIFKDRVNAVKYFAVAAGVPGAPESTKFVAAMYGSSASYREQTKQIWVSIYESSNDDIVREQAKTQIVHIEILDAVDRAIQIYKKQRGVYPKKVDDLVIAHILKEIPEDPFGFTFTIDATGVLHAK